MSWFSEYLIEYGQDDMLKFGMGNAKLDENIATFSLPAGYTCPGAKECMAMSVKKKGKFSLVTGPDSRYACFAASQELIAVSVRKQRWQNYGKLLSAGKRGGIPAMTELLALSIPVGALAVRIHVSGDFFSEDYFRAWCAVAKEMAPQPFYAYTKSIAHWVKFKHEIPDNFTLVASRGGKNDELIDEHELREVSVVFHPSEAELANLEIDHTDALAMDSTVKNFALLLHGVQLKGTPANAALRRMREEKVKFSYNAKTRHNISIDERRAIRDRKLAGAS
jgi:hypothetical protein